MADTQTYQNHARFNPLFHFTITPLLALNVIWAAVRLYQDFSLDRLEYLLLGIVLIGVSVVARMQVLIVQDRVIRLEEDLRFHRLLSPDAAQKASALPHGKKIALRFAPDSELPDLVDKVLTGKLSTNREIKLEIKNWRGDHLRA